MRKNNHAIRDMTQGSISRHLLAFAMPLFLGSLLQQFYNMVDSWVVGQFVSESALAAVGMGFSVIFMFTALFLGISNGTTVVIAQYYGAGRMERVRDVVDTVYTFFAVAAIPITIGSMLLTKPLLILMRVQPDAFADAKLYLLIVCAGIVGNIGYNMNSGILQGLGNSRASLIFLAISAVMNIILDLAFVLVFHWGVAGVAIATITAQACSWLFGIWYINRNYSEFAIRPFCKRFDKLIFKQIMGIGLPAGIQFAVISVGIMAVMSQVNAFGTSYMAGFNVGSKLDSVAFLPIQSIAFAGTTFVGQNIGAGNHSRVRRGSVLTLLYGLIWCLAMVLILYPNRYIASTIFTSAGATMVGSALYLKCILPLYPFFAIQFTLCNIMRGAGEGVIPLVVALVAQLIIRIPAVYLLAHFYGVNYMYYGFGIGWVAGALISVVYYISGRWKRHRTMAEMDDMQVQ